MKQLLQSIGKGEVKVSDVPVPRTGHGQVLVQVAASLVSAGTERMVVEFSEKNLLQKARGRPDLVRQVLDKARREGILTTLESVRNRLDQPFSLGYSCAGRVIGVGQGVENFPLDTPVACAGGGYASHAEVVSVPCNLVVQVPERVDLELTAFTTLGAIALQGIRLADVKLGEVVALIGLGLVGQLTVQMLKAAGCTVIGMDIRPERVLLARQLGADATATGAEQFLTLCRQMSAGRGVDAVLITADTPSQQPVELAGEVARDKGTVVAVGAVGMHIPRKLYYEKELDFRISRSYGPGRYDVEYEEKGHDYPIGYVRWSENRNMQAFLSLVAEGKVNVQSLITHRFPIEEASKAYDLITGKTGEPFLGVLITYPQSLNLSRRIELRPSVSAPVVDRVKKDRVTVGLLGAGNFATGILLPAMKKVQGVECVGICTTTGPSARYAGDKFGFRYCTTDEDALFADPQINTIVVATRHHLHARQVIAALRAGKHVFCEKPLCLTEEELSAIVSQLPVAGCQLPLNPQPLLLVGFNRRFAPMARQLKTFLADIHEPLVMQYRVNAGAVPSEHWVHDPQQGGGRIIGEVCHFVDLLTFLTGALPVRVYAQALPESGRHQEDNLTISLTFANGALATLAYVANGDKAFPKERIEVFGGGGVAVLDDFRHLEWMRNGRKKGMRSLLQQDKGHRGEWEAFVAVARAGGQPPIPLEEMIATTLTTFAIVESLRTGMPVRVEADRLQSQEGLRGTQDGDGGGPVSATTREAQ